jgi:hypothetical protein
MVVGRSGDFYLVSTANELIVSDGRGIWMVPGKFGTSSSAATASTDKGSKSPIPAVPSITLDPESKSPMVSIGGGEISLPLTPLSQESSSPLLLKSLLAVIREAVDLQNKLGEAQQSITSMKGDQLRMRRELTHAIPMDMSGSSSATTARASAAIMKKGASLINPRVKRAKVQKKSSDPFAANGGGREKDEEEKNEDEEEKVDNDGEFVH